MNEPLSNFINVNPQKCNFVYKPNFCQFISRRFPKLDFVENTLPNAQIGLIVLQLAIHASAYDIELMWAHTWPNQVLSIGHIRGMSFFPRRMIMGYSV